MDYLLIAAGALFMIAGILGCIIPVLPGPPLSYAGLLLLHFTDKYQFTPRFLIIWGIVTVVAFALDYIIPAWGTKKFGGSRFGVWGSIIGLFAGLLFFPPFGIIVGPFAGAVIGELVAGQNTESALKSGFGSFAGLLLGTLIKLTVSGLMLWHFIKMLFVG